MKLLVQFEKDYSGLLTHVTGNKLSELLEDMENYVENNSVNLQDYLRSDGTVMNTLYQGLIPYHVKNIFKVLPEKALAKEDVEVQFKIRSETVELLNITPEFVTFIYNDEVFCVPKPKDVKILVVND